MAQPCDRNQIGVHLKVAAEAIDTANCSEFKGLHDALRELSELLKEKADSQNASQNASATATQNVNAVSDPAPPQSVNAAPAPAPAPAPVPEFKKENSDQKVKSNDPNINVSWNYVRLMKEIQKVLDSKKSSDDTKTKYRGLKSQFENATTFEKVEQLVKDNNVIFYSNSIFSGGTRKRKTTQRKRAKTLKNKKKVGKRK
jgi:ABC-type uncharacterized transport system involved in gliding motility auxiliary subunit